MGIRSDLGKYILYGVQRSLKMNSSGQAIGLNRIKFNLKDPRILNAIPPSTETYLSVFNGRRLTSVCSYLADPKISERYFRIFKRNVNGFSDSEMNNLVKKAFPPGEKIPADVNTDGYSIALIPPNIGCHYDAHSIAKETVPSHLKRLNDILTKGISSNKKFYSMPLVLSEETAQAGAAFGAAGIYKHGSFILVSAKDKLICEDGVRHVIVNDAYYPIIDDLRKKFPHINFVKAKHCADYFKNI